MLDDTDLLVLPSCEEALGTVALEAMSRGRLVPASVHCGILEWPDLAQGMLCMAPDESLCRAIERVSTRASTDLKRIAQTAAHAARRQNAQTLVTWIDLLRQSTVNHLQPPLKDRRRRGASPTQAIHQRAAQ